MAHISLECFRDIHLSTFRFPRQLRPLLGLYQDCLYAQKLLGDALAPKESTSPEQVAQTDTRCRSPVLES